MKHILYLFIISTLLHSCNSIDNTTQKQTITVSIIPQKYFIEKISGDDFNINILVPDGSSPATYTLSPKQLTEIINSGLWFRIGYIGFEYAWKDRIHEVNPEMKIVDLSEGIDLIFEEPNQEGHSHEEGIDPHIWLSTSNVRKMSEKIKDELSLLNPDKSGEYHNNYLKFINEIDLMDIQIKQTLDKYKGKTIIVYHPSLTYFLNDHGLIQLSVENEGKEPTPQHIKNLAEIAQAENIKCIYIQDEFNKEYASLFAEEISGEIIQVSPLAEDWENNLLILAQTLADHFE